MVGDRIAALTDMATTTDIVATTTTGPAIAVGQMVSGIQRRLSPLVPFSVARSPTEHFEVGSPLAGGRHLPQRRNAFTHWNSPPSLLKAGAFVTVDVYAIDGGFLIC
jgi:hypothetical protein